MRQPNYSDSGASFIHYHSCGWDFGTKRWRDSWTGTVKIKFEVSSNSVKKILYYSHENLIGQEGVYANMWKQQQENKDGSSSAENSLEQSGAL